MVREHLKSIQKLAREQSESYRRSLKYCVLFYVFFPHILFICHIQLYEFKIVNVVLIDRYTASHKFLSSYLVRGRTDDQDSLHSPAALLTPGRPDDGDPPGRADHALPLVTEIVKPLDISVITKGTRVI